jgi:hypothetical protein
MREGAHLRDGEVDVALDRVGHLGRAAVDLGARQHDVAVPAVELAGVARTADSPRRPISASISVTTFCAVAVSVSGRLARLLQVGVAMVNSRKCPRPGSPSQGLPLPDQLVRLAKSRSFGSAATRFMKASVM